MWVRLQSVDPAPLTWQQLGIRAKRKEQNVLNSQTISLGKGALWADFSDRIGINRPTRFSLYSIIKIWLIFIFLYFFFSVLHASKLAKMY